MCDDVARGGPLDRRSHRDGVFGAREVADADALAGEKLEADEVLEADGDPLPPRRRLDLREVDAVRRDPAAGRLVEAAEELDERRLPRAVLADERDRGACGQLEIDGREDIDLGAGIAEREAVDADPVAEPRGRRQGALARRIEIPDEVGQPAEPIGALRAPLQPLQYGDDLEHEPVRLRRERDREDHVARRVRAADGAAHDDDQRADVAEREDEIAGRRGDDAFELGAEQVLANLAPRRPEPAPDLVL